MTFLWTVLGLLFTVVFPLCAQNWTPQDALRLNEMLQTEGELKLNPEVLRELGMNDSLQNSYSNHGKSWLNFREELPLFPRDEKNEVVLTLHPYSPNIPYNWDPIRKCKIKVGKNTWRGAFYELKTRMYPSNWAKSPTDAGSRSSLEEVEATGLRYVVMERANNSAVGGWKSVGNGAGMSGLDLMAPFTKDFWNFKGRKNKKRTLEILRSYALDTLILQ